MTEQTLGRKTSGPLQALTTSPLIIFLKLVKKWVETMHILGSCGVEGTFFFLLCGTVAGLDQFTLHNLKHTHGHTHTFTLWWFEVWAWWQNKYVLACQGLGSPWVSSHPDLSAASTLFSLQHAYKILTVSNSNLDLRFHWSKGQEWAPSTLTVHHIPHYLRSFSLFRQSPAFSHCSYSFGASQ